MEQKHKNGTNEAFEILKTTKSIQLQTPKPGRLESDPDANPCCEIKKKNIGFVTIWFERGQSYVTKAIVDALNTNHNTFILARMGIVFDQFKIQTDGIWNVPNLTTLNSYDIPHHVISNWIKKNKIEIIVFNEEYDWCLVEFCKNEGVKIVTYLDYLKEDWLPMMNIYDSIICSTKRSFKILENQSNATYTGWGVDNELFKPCKIEDKEFTFIHNAGWYGTNFRKMTPAAIFAFDAVSKVLPYVSLLVHSQASADKLPTQIQTILHSNHKICFVQQTIPAPGLYHKAKILLFPTKLEGLGLPLLEGLSSGLPVIATDAPPMNEFIKNGFNGLLVKVAYNNKRYDNIIFPESIIDINDLSMKMIELARNDDLINRMSINARSYAIEELNYKKFANSIQQLKIFN
jgi:glycosyltransferase involved in cell wall biosynthesis